MASPSLDTYIRWPAEAIWEAVSPQLPGFSVEILPQVDSTNSELMRRARAGQTDAVLLVAETQSAGRGRLGRQWVSQRGDSLTFSLGLPIAPQDWSGLSLAVGLSLASRSRISGSSTKEFSAISARVHSMVSAMPGSL